MISTSRNWPTWVLWLAGACAVFLTAAVVAIWQGEEDLPAKHAAQPQEGNAGTGTLAAPAQPMIDTQSSPAGQNNEPSAAAPDPFRAFLEASKNNQLPPATNQGQSGQPVTPRDPFKEFAEAVKKQAPASSISPFAR